MNKSYVFLLAGLIFTLNSYAGQNLEADLFMDLQQDMQRYSDLATDTKQNVDYMPYVISTLNNKELVELGVPNLREAVKLIPGVDLNIGMIGTRTPIFRGSNPYASGQSKLVIDGIVVNNQIFGTYNQFLDMPIDLIHRIEVVRGPDSMLPHVNGFAGSIHVITKANRDDGQSTDDTVFALAGSDKLVGAGMIKSTNLAGGHFSSDFYYQKHDLQLPVGDDRIPFPPTSGTSDHSLKNYQIGLNYQLGGLVIKGRISKNDSGVRYGQSFTLTEDGSDYLNITNNILELKYTRKLSDTVGLELALDYFNEAREIQNKVMPDGSIFAAPSIPPQSLPVGRYFLGEAAEHSFNQRLQFNMNISESHKLSIGLLSIQSRITDNNAAFSDDDLQTFTRFDMFSKDKRNTSKFFIEDTFHFNDKTTAQFGAKLSKYNDVDNQSALRLALVYRYDDANIFKTMFSQAYRQPSWREQYLNAPALFKPNLTLEAEQVDAFELAYIRHLSHHNFFKLNTFLLKNSDQIDSQNASQTSINGGKNDLYGFELEYETGIFSNDNLHLNYSYIDGENVSGALANTAQNLATAYYLYHVNTQWHYSGLLKYTGDKGRTQLDTRDDVAAYTLLDLTASYQHNKKSIKFSLSVSNVFDKTYYLPSPNNTFTGDFEQVGRTWLFRLSKEF